MSLKKDYIGTKKLCAGPAGWRCPCCNPFGCAPRRMKARARRMVRRAAKLITNQAIREES